MKRYVMEGVGTLFLTLAISLTGNPIAIGFMLMAMIFVGGHISGGHFNPAVSFALFLEKRLSSHDLMFYWLAQSIGACFALCLFMAITNNMFVPEMQLGGSAVFAMGMEALFTIVFCWVILTMVMDIRYQAMLFQPVVIGSTLMTIAFIGGLFNPAVAVGSLMCNLLKNGVMLDFPSMMIYVCGPLLGAFVASLLFNYFHKNEYSR